MLILIIVPDNHQSFSYVFSETVNNSGFGNPDDNFSSLAFWFVFGLGLLLSQYTITGSTPPRIRPRRRTTRHAGPRSACTCRWSSRCVFGWILLLAVTFQLPSTQFGIDAASVSSCPFSWAESMSQNWAEFLLFICVVAQFFCVTASVTSASRMMFAFSRDRAVPGHPLWRGRAQPRAADGRCSGSASSPAS